jgi:hypothetical protein
MADFDDEFPLPSFHEIFGDGYGGYPSHPNKKKRKSYGGANKIDGINGDETTG